jgi:flagellar hook-associated protein 2
MATISGISTSSTGTTIDVQSIVSQLMQAEQAPVNRLNKQEASYQAQLTSFGSLQGAVSAFQTAVSGLTNPSSFLSVGAATSDSSVATASTASTAVPGTYTISVSKLAQRQKLVAAGKANFTDAIGTGTLSFDFGTISGAQVDPATGKYTGATFTSSGGAAKTVTIDSSNNTLTGIRDAINATGIGITATIVNDGSANPYRLVLTANTPGAANSIRISGGDAGLSALLAHDPGTAPNSGTQNLAEMATAQNANLTVDGMAISKASNTLSDVVPGVTINLAKTTVNAPPITLSVTRDASSVQGAVKSFVDGYNALAAALKSLTGYDAASKTAGPLQGDFTATSVDSAVRRLLTASLVGAGGYNTLSQLGVAFQKDGSLALDSTKLQAAVTANPADVAAVFAQTGRATDSLVSYLGAGANTKPGSYAVNITTAAARGNTVGSAAVVLPLTITANVDDALQVVLDGKNTTVTLDARTYTTAADLALAVQAKINGASVFSSAGHSVIASSAGGVITLTSSSYGSASGIAVTGTGAANVLGGTPTVTPGVDVAGTIGGVAATGSGQTLSGVAGSDAAGLQLQVAGTATGNRGTVGFSQGYAYQLNRLANSLLDPAGAIATRTSGINKTIKDIGKQRDAVNVRLAMIQQNYTQQFTALDTMLSSMNATSTYLTQQLNNLPGFYTSSSKG